MTELAATLDTVALAQALIRRNTVDSNEEDCIGLVEAALTAAGFQCTRSAFAPRRTSLLARLGGGQGPAGLCFTGHVDVVPTGSMPWKHDPFGADIVEGCLYGRGSSDMKSGVAAFVAAATALAPKLASSRGLTLVITAGEESGCQGAFHLVRDAKTRALLGTAEALLVGEPTANQPVLGHKGAFWLSARATGKTAHGSMPEEGDNAIYKIARAALALEKLDLNVTPHPIMGKPTINLGRIAGGDNINSVADAAELEIDIRTVAGQDHAQVLRCVCEALGSDIGLTRLLDIASIYTAPEQAWVQHVLALCQAATGMPWVPRTVTYFSDAAALLEPLGKPPVVILGPGEPSLAHQTDEYCRVDHIHQAQSLYEQIILERCL